MRLYARDKRECLLNFIPSSSRWFILVAYHSYFQVYPGFIPISLPSFWLLPFHADLNITVSRVFSAIAKLLLLVNRFRSEH